MIATHELQKLVGRITHIRWQDPNGTARCIVMAEDEGGRAFSVLGEIEDPAIGQTYEFEGALGYNERYSTREMKLAGYRTVLPSDTQGIERYLVEVAKWVRAPIARRLTKAFGGDTLNVIKTDPERVAEQIKGITLARAVEMRESLLKNEARERLAIEVHQLVGSVLTLGQVRKAIGKWGMETPERIRRNPFALTDIYGVGFAQADLVWRSLQLPLNALRRHVAAVVHAAEDGHRQGHTAVTEDLIVHAAQKLVGPLLPRALRAAKLAGLIKPNGYKAWATAEIAEAEDYVACDVRSLLATDDDEDDVQVDTSDLAVDQTEAARMFERSPLMILTGGPGTGKTYTTARLIQALGDRRVALCAPTGKAAKQMTNALADTCGGRAKTIHRLLGPVPDHETGEFHFTYGPGKELDAQAFVIDEFSMVDVRLAAALLGAIRNGARVLIVGDKHQLPSVGAGAVLRDLIAAGVPSFELTEIKRNTGRIVRACHDIKDGSLPEPADALNLEAGDNWVHIEARTPEDVRQFIESMYEDELPAMGLGNLTWDVQTIAPTNKHGGLSCEALNTLIQPILNPDRTIERKLDFSVGDKVLRTRNAQVKGYMMETDEDEPGDLANETVMVVNGDLGIVRGISKKEVVVEFMNPRRMAKLDRGSHSLKPAYCITCHKMQGSEANVIILPVHGDMTGSPIWCREWIYTAFSRAKVALFTIGQLSALEPGIRRIGNTQRRTNLKRLLCGEPEVVRY